MTPTERATKIIEQFFPGSGPLSASNEFVSAIAVQIEEAVKEGQQFYYDEITEPAIRQAKAEGFAAGKLEGLEQAELGQVLKDRNRGSDDGFAAAREKAALIAMDVNDPGADDFCGEEIAERIRGMKP